MRHGSKCTTRKGDREIISVSLPVNIYEAMQELIDRYDMNRSALVTRAIVDYIRSFGIRVGEN